jgi:hypothetical protein
MARVVCAALLAGAALMPAGAAAAAGDAWRWVRVEPPGGDDHWGVLQGEASVEFKGCSFSVSLTRPGTSFAEFKITGAISGDRVAATEVHENTDASPIRYTGRILQLHSPAKAPSRGWGEDTIDLHAGPWFVGLNRQTGPGAPRACKGAGG